ncbi:hypothetical protein [Halalkalicoccus ordinarius]|uniref:hypothetical protein n=1 Tax=Halalkalicoccus ordinarius TaxID=3116651 RepID=UPI00300F2753
MNRTFGFGAGLTVSGLVGYAIGVTIAYPGRALSVTAVLIGIAIAAAGLDGP